MITDNVFMIAISATSHASMLLFCAGRLERLIPCSEAEQTDITSLTGTSSAGLTPGWWGYSAEHGSSTPSVPKVPRLVGKLGRLLLRTSGWRSTLPRVIRVQT